MDIHFHDCVSDGSNVMSDEKLFNKRLKNYLIGGLGALALTLSSFILIMNHVVSGLVGGAIILCLAAAQAIVQLYLFLHLGEEKKPYWKNFSFLFTILTVGIIIGGSVWVVSRMNYHMMLTPDQVTQYMQKQSEKGF